MMAWTFMIEELSNGAWHVGWRTGHDDYGRVPPDRAGFSTYAEAEKFALMKLKSLMRQQRDAWATEKQKKVHEARLAAALKTKAA